MRTLMAGVLGALAFGVFPAMAGGEEAAPMAFPKVVLEKAGLKLTVYLPDAAKGFYRGMRFDASGLIAKAQFAGRSVYGPFQTTYDATLNDNVAGPAEEFDMDVPPGWDEARPGEPFMKIGVGLLAKLPPAPAKPGEEPPEHKYEFWRKHEILDPGRWKVIHRKDWIEFQHELTGKRDRAYVYTKRITLAGGSPGFTIAHVLRNTGSKPIDTVVYNHNFTVIDSEPVGPAYRITFPFDLKPKEARGNVEFKGRRLVMPTELKGDTVWVAFEGADFPPAQHTVTIENTRTGTGVTVRGDRPVAEWRFFAARTAACPEPFVRLHVAPGKTEIWKADYTLLAGKPE